MSQIWIREYDAKMMFASMTKSSYTGQLITKLEDCDLLDTNTLRVIKPDQLFGKRGKLWLVGVKKTPEQVRDRVSERFLQNFTMPDGKTDKLHTFLAEEFVPHMDEYYIAIKQMRDGDMIYFSLEWGMEVEENRENVRELLVPTLENIPTLLDSLFMKTVDESIKQTIVNHITNLFNFYRSYGLVYLEINPFVIAADGSIVNLDMVAKIDTCEAYRQSEHWKTVEFVKPFGTQSYPAEDTIAALDEKTGASLKLTIINPHGRLWFLLWWWWASVIVMDSLANAGLMHEIANYGELSGNPDADSNQAYVQTILDMMFANTAEQQYLCLIGGIANFTNIYALAKPFADLIVKYSSELKANNIHILMRRGGINDVKAQELIRQTCIAQGIKHTILTADDYLSEFVGKIEL
jgi:ATP-citrate lyase beta-subunit